MPRGIRNNNPLNIRRTADRWEGLCPLQTDPKFCQFESMEYGWRAAFCLLTLTYYHKYCLHTIRGIISRWAPPSENPTEAYIKHVSGIVGIGPDECLGHPSEHPARWQLLAAAMATHENGITPDWQPMLKGWEMARGQS